MGEKVVHFSDFTGAPASPEALAQVTVVEHPDYDQPRLLEALPEELADIGKLALQPVVVEVALPGEQETQRYTLTMANFGKLAVGRKMADVLAEAPEVARQLPQVERPVRERKDYASLDFCGEPHKGKTSPEEAALVRANLEAVNARLVAKGLRPIDAENPEHRKRYGFDQEPQPMLELVQTEQPTE